MSRPSPRWLIAGLTVSVAAVGAAALGWHLRERHESFFTDADSIRRPVDAASPRDVLWRPPQRLADIINTDADQYAPSVTADGVTLFFAAPGAGGDADIHVSTLSPRGWSDPQPVAALNTDADEMAPAVSPDGRTLYLCSNRHGGVGEYDLWAARRGDGQSPEWSAPVNLGPRVNTRYDDSDPAVTPDGGLLYFASNRPAVGGQPTPAPGDFNIYTVGLLNPAIEAAPATALNTPLDDTAPAVSPAGDFVYFASNRDGGSGGFDLYRARRLGGSHTAPESLGDPVNTAADELDPAVSLGGFGLHFASRGSRPDYDLHYTTSREVFTQTDAYRASIDWASLWALLWPYLLWLAVTLLLLLMLVALFRRLEYRRLTLLAKCLLVSLLVHLLLLISFAFWGITASLSEWTRPGSGTRVLLVSPSIGAGAAEQIRGDLIGVETEAPFPEPTTAPQRAAADASIAEPARPAAPTVQVRRSSMDVPAEPTAMAEAREAPEAADDLPAPRTTSIAEPARTMDLPVDLPADADRSRRAEAASTIPPSAIRHTTATRAGIETPRVADAPPVTAGLDAPPADPGRETADLRFAQSAPPEGSPAPGPRIPAAHAQRDQGEQGDPAPLELSLALPAAVVMQAPAGRATEPSLQAPRSRASVERADAAGIAPLVAAPPDRDAPEAPVASPARAGSAAATSLAVVQAPDDAPAAPPEAAAPASASAATVRRPDTIDLRLPEPEESVAAAGPEAPEAVVAAAAVPKPARRLPPAVDLGRRATARPTPDFDPPVGAAPLGAGVPLRPDREPADAPPSPARRSAPAAEAPLLAMDLDLALPETEAPSPYRQRAPQRRREILEQMGGSVETERAVALALDWLARHQSAEGKWDGDDFDQGCGRCAGVQKVRTDIALTGLSLLCFLAADHTHVKDGPYRRAVRRGLDWLVSQQRESGSLMSGESMYSHGIATIALVEAYGMTRDPALAGVIEAAVDFIYDARNTAVGGWRYRPGQIGDTSVMGWQVMALTSARRAGIEVPDEAFDVARRWLSLVHRESRPGQYAYQPQRDVTPAMTAEGMFINQLLGTDRAEPHMQGSAAYILRHPPRWEPDANTYYWYYATLALFQHQGPAWQRWNEAVTAALLGRQHTEGAIAGSWDPDGQWASVAGRVYQTAISTLTLEVYYRYLPLYVQDVEDESRD